MNKILLFSLITIVIGTTLYFVIFNRASLSNSATDNASLQASQPALLTQSATIGTVAYKITPKDLRSSISWEFEVTLDTHTGSLDQDLVSEMRIIDDKGNLYKAIAWNGDPPGGHHREGVLRFAPIIPLPAFIELNIETANSVKTSLRWDI